MSSFPAIRPFKSEIAEKIQNTNKETFSGSSPFIQLTKFANGAQTIGYNSYTSFSLANAQNNTERFPPLITGLEVGNSGTLGAIRRAKIHVKFASVNQLTTYKDFLLIGNTQMVSWGWVNNNTKFTGNNLSTAASIVANITNWENQIAKYGYEVDMMAGPLVNFDFKINDDATVDCTLELGSPSEIPGFLALNKKKKVSSTEAKTDSDNLVNVYQALNLDGDGTGTDEEEVKSYTINFTEDKIDKVSTWGETDNVYVQLGFAINAIVNKFREKSSSPTEVQLIIDLEDSIAMGHPNMISVSENFLFPNPNTMGFLDTKSGDKSRLLTPTTTATQPFGPFNGTHVFPESEVKINMAGVNSSIKGGNAGHIKNIYVYTEFLKNTAKGCENVNDFLDKVIAELNIAGAGLFNLVRREVANKDGKLIYTIADLNLAQDKVKVTQFNIFGTHSRVTNISINCDLPKEIVAMMAIPSEDPAQQDDNPGIRMFARVNPDPVMKLADKIATPKSGKPIEGEDTSGFITKAMNWVSTSWKQAFHLPGENRIKFAKSAKFGDSGANPMYGVFKDVSCVKNIYFPEGYARRHALVPISVSFTILGLSGVTVGSALKLNPSPVPWLQSTGYWQVTGVEHKVDDGKWETTIECKFRVSNEIK